LSITSKKEASKS